MINYYYPKYLKYNNDFYLFFDIFIKNNDLFIIVPIYDKFILDENKLYIIFNNKQLILKEAIKYIEYEGIIILKFEINSELNINNEFKIIYDKITSFINIELIIKDKINIINNNICISTLFKDDYFLLDTWIEYYSKKNLTDFYLYVNSKIEKIKDKLSNILKKYNRYNITIIEWDFNYWNNTPKFKHHAQIGMLNHCLYNYAKNFNYWLNIDLDEYINNINIIDNNFDLYLYNNRWAKLENNNTPSKYLNLYNTKFYLGNIQHYSKKNNNDNICNFIKTHKNKIYLLINRTKWIINTNKFKAVGIHLPKFIFNYNYHINNTDLWFAHFSNWTNSNVRNHFFEDNYILNNHFYSSL
jgi:hypothetical protein